MSKLLERQLMSKLLINFGKEVFVACRGYNIGAHWPSVTVADNSQGASQEAPSGEADGSSACHVAQVQQAYPPAADVAQEHSWATLADGQGLQEPAPVHHRIGTQSLTEDADVSGSLGDAGAR